MTLGMTSAEANAESAWRGAHSEGRKLKEPEDAFLWTDHVNRGTNSSGFTALPAGFRSSSGSYDGIDENAYFWTSLEFSGTHAWSRQLANSSASVYRQYTPKPYGISVRCVQD